MEIFFSISSFSLYSLSHFLPYILSMKKQDIIPELKVDKLIFGGK